MVGKRNDCKSTEYTVRTTYTTVSQRRTKYVHDDQPERDYNACCLRISERKVTGTSSPQNKSDTVTEALWDLILHILIFLCSDVLTGNVPPTNLLPSCHRGAPEQTLGCFWL